MKGFRKGMCTALAGLMLLGGAGAFAACGDGTGGTGGTGGGTGDGAQEYEHLSSSDLPATTSVISVERYRDKVKGGLVGTMAGVAYGYPVEFHYKNWIPESSLPNWYDEMIQNAYDQDDVYLSVTAIEALKDLGLDATSRELGIYTYNKDFEFWNGSNNDVLARGFAPPFSGYPKYSTTYLTGAYPDGNSYQCGASFGGFLGLNMTGWANDVCHRFAEICCYGDGIYSMQFIAAMYGAAFFTDDIGELIDAGLAAIPADSWSALVINDVLKNHADGMSAYDNYQYLQKTYVNSDEYNWIGWPSGGILLDAKMCSAFTLIGLLYGEGDIQKSMELTVSCAHDSDSTAAATAGILATIQGYSALDAKFKNGLIKDQKFKYSQSTVDGVVDNCDELIRKIVVREGGKIAYVDEVLSIVIPAEAKTAEIEDYENSKYPSPMELMTYSEEETAQMRTISDPGFERSTNQLANGWSTNAAGQVSIEWMKQTARTGLCNALIRARKGTDVEVYTSASVEENTNYTLTFWVKAGEGFASDVSLVVRNASGDALRTLAVSAGGGEWTQVTMTVNSGKNTSLRLGILVTGANDTDTLKLDDVAFQKII